LTEQEIKVLLEQVRQVAREEAKATLSKSVQVSPGVVVSVASGVAVVKLAIDASKTFSVPITTPQTIAVNDNVNIAYWNNLSTAILLSKG
jgi:catalase (peroxidase I)